MAINSYAQADEMAPFVIAGDNFNFFVGDENCNEITEIRDTELKGYMCVT